VVEGEKCADAVSRILPSHVTVTWAGGASAWRETDWTALAHRDVILWPDADDPGRKAMAALAQRLLVDARRVRVLHDPDRSDGWDAADAIAEGMDAAILASYIDGHVREVTDRPADRTADPTLTAEPGPPSEPTAEPTSGRTPKPRAPSLLVQWGRMPVTRDAKGIPHATLANASAIIRHEFGGKIWWDSFHERIYTTLLSNVPRPWSDVDSSHLAVHLQHRLQLHKFTLAVIHDAVVHAAHQDMRNSVVDWLTQLQWDGQERLSYWVGDALGVTLTPYTMAVSRNWLLSMVYRAYQPGCKVDTMPVLEGLQGIRKSSALEIIGGEWFACISSAFGDKEFAQTIQGKWLVEIPDMSGFSRREHTTVLGFLANRSDRYRASYGRYAEDHPRRCVFAATSETDDYLVDLRGHRRYWPLRCTAVDVHCLKGQRDQLFAEAVALYRRGEPYYEMPERDTGEEQRARGHDDLWTEPVLAYLRSRPGLPVHPASICRDALEIRVQDMTQAHKLRVINILASQGYVRKTINNQRV